MSERDVDDEPVESTRKSKKRKQNYEEIEIIVIKVLPAQFFYQYSPANVESSRHAFETLGARKKLFCTFDSRESV